ncbi:efflux RND transporter permease subunit [Mangrovibacterium diazotrophicum]|uniref:Multidrug efflux pump subunit AcrB n=1 Tax=Mangrovibacterium diazotrophicum TaxID=1261403 RepID=A0A419VV95_9BACT|nr:efflux RND transporter permease subunit [Mangrovibacterium diazotrophicum]RKD86058.1 multidrug efflux pump subunit AcrB [Mangrovibacterium diazotrophicum]
MRKIVETFVRFPFYANLIVLFLLIVGGISLVTMKLSFFPERPSKMIYVRVSYPGASPVEMEEGVTSRIEEAVRGIPGIYEITSTSAENSASVQIEITGDINIDETLIEVKNAVDGISSFPTAAERPIVYKQRTTSPAARLVVTGDVDLLTLKDYAQQIEEDFLSSGYISQVSLSGYPDLEISVEAHEETLLRYGITFTQLQNAVTQNNRDVSGGQLRSDDEEMLIRLRSRSADPNKIGEIILKANSDGSVIRIRDVATVKKKFSDITPDKSLEQGNPVISISVSKLISEDLGDIDEYIQDYVNTFNEKTHGVRLIITRSFIDLLKSRLDLLLVNGGQGLFLVVVLLALMLSLRLSFWVAWGIPSSFLAMFIVANLAGITINMISLFGMILVIGILVDDGIVIGENIFQHFERGKNPIQAAVDGTVEVVPAVITSVLTTVLAFSPLFFISGNMEMMFEMAFIVVVSLLFSLFESFFVLPAHIGNEHVLNPDKLRRAPKGLKKYTEQFFTWLRDYAYDRVLKLVIEWRYIVIFVPVAMLLITFGMLGGQIIKTTFFPRMEFDSFNVNVAFTPGSGEKQTMAYLQRFEDAVWQVNEDLMEDYGDTVDIIEYCTVNLGSGFDRAENGTHTGNVFVSPRNSEETGISSFEIINRVREKIGPIPEAVKYTIGARGRFGDPVSIGLQSRHPEELELAQAFLIERLQKMPQLKDVVNTNALGKQEILLKLKPKAYMLGFNEGTVSEQVRQGFYGGQAQRLQVGRDELRVWVRYPAEDRERLGQLERMKLKTTSGEYPLTELVDYEMKRGPVNIQRFNGRREIRVNADLVDPDASVTEILEQIKREIIPDLNVTFPGIHIEYQGQQKESARNMNDIAVLFPMAFLGIIFILMINFRSFEQPLIILIMIPISILGAVWGHGIHGKPVSILSLWGIVALSGVVINDSVVMLSKFNSLIEEGFKVKDAILEAGKSRLRPIILTTLTTSAGLFPLVLEKSFQAQFLIPMAISLVYGVAFGTLFILLFFPALVIVLNDIRRVLRELYHGRPFEREEVEIAYINYLRKNEGKTQTEIDDETQHG